MMEKCIDIDNYALLIEKKGTYAGGKECAISSKVLNINIIILIYDSIYHYYTFHSFYRDLIEKELKPLCILE